MRKFLGGVCLLAAISITGSNSAARQEAGEPILDHRKSTALGPYLYPHGLSLKLGPYLDPNGLEAA